MTVRIRHNDLRTSAPVETVSPWPNYATTFTFAPDGSPHEFFRVKAIAAAAP
jgi:hypothetical protein